MKKLILLSVVFLALSCKGKNEFVRPVEFYKNKGIIVIDAPINIGWYGNKEIRCKTKDSIFDITLTDFDVQSLKVGDTIK